MIESVSLTFNKIMFTILTADPPAAEGESSAGLGTLGISWSKMLWQLLAFAILFFIFWRFVLPSMLKFLDERRQRAIEIVEGSDKIKRELAETEARTRQILVDANKQAQDIVTQANATSERIVNETAAKAQAAQQAEVEKAKIQIAAERDSAIAGLRREAADLAILAATKVIRQELSMNPELQRKLINDVLSGDVNHN